MSGKPTDITDKKENSSWNDESVSKRRRDVFGDCALIEIIHLHDCLRGAVREMGRDVADLVAAVRNRSDQQHTLERRITGRFKVIWSVFRAHSAAEDEFIWPALQSKTQGRINGSHKYKAGESWEPTCATESKVIEKEEYEEDHADEERMFSQMDELMSTLREQFLRPGSSETGSHDSDHTNESKNTSNMWKITQDIDDLSKELSHHLMAHLQKEEEQCLPLVVKHLSTDEINDLVGQIMGKRSADTIAQIMTMAVQNLDESDRMEMVNCMKQAMSGTYFDRWLQMSGWMATEADEKENDTSTEQRKRPADLDTDARASKVVKAEDNSNLDSEIDEQPSCMSCFAISGGLKDDEEEKAEIMSQAELEKFIRAIATNSSLSDVQKNATIQGLRDSVWKSNQRSLTNRANLHQPTVVNTAVHTPFASASGIRASSGPSGFALPVSCGTPRRVTPPSMYYKRNQSGKIELVWTSETRSPPTQQRDDDVPLFSAAELAPTYHDGAAGTVLGCPHYAQSCKLRHPVSGRLYTCRLCCDQEREHPMKDKDEPLDRYAVTEVMCMKCQALQPAEDRCINPDCDSRGRPFAKYFCRICHLYDNSSDKKIFHCPYCNICRLGAGLGIDFRHCMRCNACVSLYDDEHQCIPQKLQGDCPICHEILFQSTEPLRGLKCGHVMHLSCYTEYRRGHSYTCPLCMRSMEDMREYFALLDAAVRMQPMPAVYLTTRSNIYCQDCGETCQVPYHFVGLKCNGCGSYNTREMSRVNMS